MKNRITFLKGRIKEQKDLFFQLRSATKESKKILDKLEEQLLAEQNHASQLGLFDSQLKEDFEELKEITKRVR